MPLNAGTRLGPFEILAPLGAGGMGEVYRARDTRLGRDVAIKVLPQHLTTNAEVRARFEREARTVSGLNHPNICTLFDVGREGETDYLVMELVDGETLAQRLTRGPLPYADVLRLGGQIADALDRAHRSGVIHRDLKPGNVMLTRAGAKLMDFGLARAAASGTPVSASGATLGALTQSPTMVSPLTAEGAIVGTFQYMAPEQLEGREADARSDLWSFGAMLYEMATGRRAFEGRSQASLIAAILERDPAPMTSSPSTPGSPDAPLASLEPLVRACLAKDPDERVQTAHDVKLQLRWLAGGSSTSTASASTTSPAVPGAAVRSRTSPLPWIVATVAAAAAFAFALVALRAAPPRGVTRFTIGAGPELRTMTWPRLSPDGRVLAFVGTDTSGVTRVWLRPLDALDATPLAGTEGAGRPFWSPDGRSIGYFSNGRLVKVAIGGGPPQVVAEGTGGFDGAWGSRGIVVYDGSAGDSIRAIPIAGGAPVGASHIDRRNGQIGHNWPLFLPDGRHFLAMADLGGGKGSHLFAYALDSKEEHDLGPIASRVEYAAEGYLLWVAQDVLLARPFDAKALRFTGDAFTVASNVSASGSRANLTASAGGTIAYANGSVQGENQLVWFDRTGKRLGVAGPPAAYGDLALSPDGKRVAYDVADRAGSSQVWVRDLVRDVASRITFGPGNAIWPIWSPDGRRIAYSADRSGAFSLYLRDASGAGDDSLVRASDQNEGATDWSPSGPLVIGHYSGSSGDIEVIEPRVGAPHHAVIATPLSEQLGHLSPDGKWLAYVSSESGTNEVYVQTYPLSGGKWQISSKGGTMPQWRGDGREIFYYSATREIRAVTFMPGPSPEIGVPVTLFEQVLAPGGIMRSRYVATADGRRFLLNVPPSDLGTARFTVIENWTSGITKK